MRLSRFKNRGFGFRYMACMSLVAPNRGLGFCNKGALQRSGGNPGMISSFEIRTAWSYSSVLQPSGSKQLRLFHTDQSRKPKKFKVLPLAQKDSQTPFPRPLSSISPESYQPPQGAPTCYCRVDEMDYS